MGYYLFCGTVNLIFLILQSFFGVLLITPREVGGTLFGGMFLDLARTGGWLLMSAGLIVLILSRFTGTRVALLCASAIQMAAGVWSLLNYPDDMSGNLIYSPARDEIYLMTLFVGLIFFASFYLIRKGYLQPKTRK